MQKTKREQIKALIHLLEGETAGGAGAEVLRGELARVMKEQPQYLHEVITRDFRSSVPAALVTAMEEICWEELAGACGRFTAKINPDLEEALAIETRFVNPAFTSADIAAELDLLALTLRPLLITCNGTEDIARTLGRFFFRIQGFNVLSCSHDIKDISFGRFLQKKQGSSLCMASLYAVLAARFGVEAGIVDMAGRVLAYFAPQQGETPVFADPADKGKLLSLADCRKYIDARGLEWSWSFAAPLSSRAALRRFLGNMIFLLNKLRDERRLAYLRRYMDILKN